MTLGVWVWDDLGMTNTTAKSLITAQINAIADRHQACECETFGDHCHCTLEIYKLNTGKTLDCTVCPTNIDDPLDLFFWIEEHVPHGTTYAVTSDTTRANTCRLYALGWDDDGLWRVSFVRQCASFEDVVRNIEAGGFYFIPVTYTAP